MFTVDFLFMVSVSNYLGERRFNEMNVKKMSTEQLLAARREVVDVVSSMSTREQSLKVLL